MQRMIDKLSSIHFYIFVAIIVTIFIDHSGLLTKSVFELYKIEYSNQNVVAKLKLNPSKIDVAIRHKEKESLNLTIHPNGFEMSSLLIIHSSGSTPEFKDKYIQRKLKCFIIDHENVCRLPMSLSGTRPTQLLLYAKDGDILFHSIGIKTYRAKRATPIIGTLIYGVYLVMAILGVLIARLRVATANRLLICISAVGLFLLNAEAFLLIFIFLFVSFYLIQAIYKAKSGKKRHFTVFMFVVLVSLFAVKILLPHVGQYFLNPGGVLLVMPLGFSYFIIKIIDMGVDAYKKSLKGLTLVSYLAYMLFPATLAAGPIKTYKQYNQAKIEEYSVVDYAAGISRVLLGISKKLIADIFLLPVVNGNMGLFIDKPDEASSILVFTMLITNFFYIYLDFSSYCDMAIGSARSMGYRVPENFKWPLFRTSISHYWQNWHITLSSWVRKNVFMNVLLSTRSVFLSTFSTMLVIGLWHKLSLGWLSWALHHSVIMSAETFLKSHYRFNFSKLISNRLIMATLINVRTILMVCYVWFMVAAGQSFIVFSDFSLSVKAYGYMFLFLYERLGSILVSFVQ